MTEPTPADRVKALQTRSSYVENVLKHALVADLASIAWKRSSTLSLQVFNSEVDDSGFDIVLGFGTHVRYVQLKQSHAGKKLSKCSVRTSFASRPGACVVLMIHNLETLKLEEFRFLGGGPLQPMPAIDGFRQSRAPGRRNAAGVRKIREQYRDVRIRTFFSKPKNIDGLFDLLFPNHAT